MPAPHHPPTPRDRTAETAMLTVSIWHERHPRPRRPAHRLQRIHPWPPDGERLHLRHPGQRAQPCKRSPRTRSPPSTTPPAPGKPPHWPGSAGSGAVVTVGRRHGCCRRDRPRRRLRRVRTPARYLQPGPRPRARHPTPSSDPYPRLPAWSLGGLPGNLPSGGSIMSGWNKSWRAPDRVAGTLAWAVHADSGYRMLLPRNARIVFRTRTSNSSRVCGPPGSAGGPGRGYCRACGHWLFLVR
jgi:hypothetical protein